MAIYESNWSVGTSNFLYTLYMYRTFIYVRLYILKNYNQYSYGFCFLMSIWGGHHFRNYNMCVSFEIFGSKLVIFDFDDLLVFWKFIRLFENFENLFCRAKLDLKALFKHTYTQCNFRNHARNHQVVKARCSYIVPSGSRSKHLHERPEGPNLRMDGMGWG